MINNNAYGGFIVSKNIISGVSVKYSFREKSSIKQLNGWNLLSQEDDDEYVQNSNNFIIVNAESILKIVPVLLEIFDAPYGTDWCWIYKEGVHIGFYDLKTNRDITIEEIIKTHDDQIED